MTHPTGTFRWLVTVLTALCVPLCCCSLDSLFGDCGACGGEDAVVQNGCHDEDAQAGSTPGKACCHHHGSQQVADHSATHQKHKDSGCTCGSDKKIGTSGPDSKAPVPPITFAYVVPETAPLRLPIGMYSVLRAASWSLLRPDRTLLRLHCALIV